MYPVYLRKTDDRRGFVRSVVKEFWALLCEAESVFIKPNIVSYEPYPTTTHPDVLAALLELLPNSRVVVGDGPAFDAGSADKLLEQHPLRDVCREFGVPLVNLYRLGMESRASSRGFSVKLSTYPAKFDLVISLPVLKEHMVCGITGALKNQFGLLARFERIKMHTGIKNIHRSIAELNAILTPDLFIVDAVETLLVAQEVRHGGHRTRLGYMLAGVDPVALDSVGVRLLAEVDPDMQGVKPEDIPHLQHAIKYGLGNPKPQTTRL